jgi:VWFA-related protein
MGQAPVPQEPQPPVLSSQTSLVITPALVRTRSGDLVFALAADDFELTDDGVPQKLTLEQDTGGEPLALVVVVEIGGAGARELDKLGHLAPMLESVFGGVAHTTAVVAFDSQPFLVQDFTARNEAAADAIVALTSGCSKQDRLTECSTSSSIHPVRTGDNGAAILDSLGFAVDLLRNQPLGFRRAILLVSETLDRGSQLTVEEAVQAIDNANTAIYSIGFSTGKSEATRYGYRELPIRPGWVFENQYPNPPMGCMGKDPDPDLDATHNRPGQAYDCLTQLAPPLALAKLAAIATTDGLRRNVPKSVAQLTGGEYFKLSDAKSLERSLVTIANHLPNRYVLSFQPQSPHPGFHAIALRVPNYSDLAVTARTSYWASPQIALPQGGSVPR